MAEQGDGWPHHPPLSPPCLTALPGMSKTPPPPAEPTIFRARMNCDNAPTAPVSVCAIRGKAAFDSLIKTGARPPEPRPPRRSGPRECPPCPCPGPARKAVSRKAEEGRCFATPPLPATPDCTTTGLFHTGNATADRPRTRANAPGMETRRAETAKRVRFMTARRAGLVPARAPYYWT